MTFETFAVVSVWTDHNNDTVFGFSCLSNRQLLFYFGAPVLGSAILSMIANSLGASINFVVLTISVGILAGVVVASVGWLCGRRASEPPILKISHNEVIVNLNNRTRRIPRGQLTGVWLVRRNVGSANGHHSYVMCNQLVLITCDSANAIIVLITNPVWKISRQRILQAIGDALGVRYYRGYVKISKVLLHPRVQDWTPDDPLCTTEELRDALARVGFVLPTHNS